MLSVAAATYVAGQLAVPEADIALAEAAAVQPGGADFIFEDAAAVYIEMGATYYVAYHFKVRVCVLLSHCNTPFPPHTCRTALPRCDSYHLFFLFIF